MTEQNETRCTMSPATRLAICVAIGASLAVSNNPATGIAVAAGLYLALMLDARRS